MTLTIIRAGKNLPLIRYEAEEEIEASAARTRARFATPGKHVIYDKKLREAERYLEAVSDGKTPANLNKYPYMAREVGPGKTAPTALELANLWVSMNANWEQVSALIEEVSVTAKAQVKASNRSEDIETITAAAVSVLDGIGTRPPKRPKTR